MDIESEKILNSIEEDEGKTLSDYIAKNKDNAHDFISKNINEIISKLKDGNVVYFTGLLINCGLTDIITENFELIMRAFVDQGGSFPYVLREIKSKNENSLKDKVEIIIAIRDKNDLFNIVQILKDIPGINLDLLNKALEDNQEEIIWNMMKKSIRRRCTPQKWKEIEDDLYSYVPTVKEIINELLTNEEKRWVDIKEMVGGAYSIPYKIGSKILKIGQRGGKYEIPNHRRLLQPLLRLDLIEKEHISLEVEEKVKTVKVSDEELYKMYKEVRDAKIILADFKPDNIGRLIKPNKVYFNGIERVFPSAIGFDRELKEEEILPAGELVFFDLDYIYREGDKDIIWSNPYAKRLNDFYRFEAEYKRSIDQFEIDDK